MRKLLITAVVLLGLLVGADRIAASIAADVIASRLQTAGSLTHKPDVSIGGFPFLTQALNGRYDRIELTARDINRRYVRIAQLDVTVVGARVRYQDALAGSVGAVPVEGVTARVVLAFADVADVAAAGGLAGATVQPSDSGPGDGGLTVTARVTVLGRTVTVTSRATVSLELGALVIRSQSHLLDFRVPVGTLPYGLRLTGLRITPAGFSLTASSGPTVLLRP